MLKFFKHNMKQIFCWVLIGSLLSTPMGELSVSAEEPGNVAAIEEENIAADEMILVYDDAGASKKESQKIQAEAEDVLSENQIEVDEVIAESSKEQGTVVVAKVPEDMDIEAVAEEVGEDENIAFAQPNYEYQLMEDVANGYENDSENMDENGEILETLSATEKEYYLSATYTLEAWKDTAARAEKKVTVAIFDTGCRLDHEDLEDNINMDLAYDAVTGKLLKQRKEENGFLGDLEGHGTHVAGLVAAKADNAVGIEGTSYNAEILPIKISSDAGKIYTGNLYKAFKYCIDNIKKIHNLKVINISLGGYTDQTDSLIEQTINLMRDEYGVLCVCAGGNGYAGKPITEPSYPSDLEATLSVTSLDKNGKDSVWSDYNPYKDISAPGEHIKSTIHTGKSAYEEKDGTSMATPIVSGICALLWAKYPTLTVDEVVEAIKTSATPIPDQDENRKKNSGSAGAINAKAALDLAGELVNDVTDDTGKTSIEDAVVELPQEEYEYTGNYFKPQPNVSFHGETLTKGVDYIVTYSKNRDAGTATVCVTGIGNYYGSQKVNFVIRPIKLFVDGEYKIFLSGKSEHAYTGSAVCPEYTVKRRALNSQKADVTLVKDKDYSVSYMNNTEAGNATVVITGKGNYAALNTNGEINSVTGTFRIVKNLNQCLASVTSATTYTGNYVFPRVTVKDGNKTLIENQDYVLSISNNKNVGNAQVRVTGIGFYNGSLIGNAKIVPKGTSISKLYRRSKGFQVKWKKQTTQTTGYQIQYSLYSDFRNAKIKTVKKNKTVSLKISKLKKKKYYYVRVRTYKKIGSEYFYSGWSKVKKVKTK